jgi:hypothetical protein
MGLFVLLILSRVLYICLPFSLIGDCCGRDRMEVLFSASNSIIPYNQLFIYKQSLGFQLTVK